MKSCGLNEQMEKKKKQQMKKKFLIKKKKVKCSWKKYNPPPYLPSEQIFIMTL